MDFSVFKKSDELRKMLKDLNKRYNEIEKAKRERFEESYDKVFRVWKKIMKL
jgi:chromosome segregation ATPase